MMLLSVLLVVLPGIIDNVGNDGRIIVVIGDRGGIHCRSANMMITIKLILLNNVRVSIKFIPPKDLLGDGREGTLI